MMIRNNVNLCTLSSAEYQNLLRELKRVTAKACRRYKIHQLLQNPEEVREITHDICINALLKAIKTYNRKKSAFTTYFYYKASSLARVAAIKIKHRYSLLNTIPLDEGRTC